jgi:hypothetical protein
MQQELKTHIAKIESKLLRHESTDQFTFEFVSDLVQSFKDIVEKPIDTTKDVYEIRKERNFAYEQDFYHAYKNDNYFMCCGMLESEAPAILNAKIESMKSKNVIYRTEVSNG